MLRHMTFRKILCPIDFSPGSQRAMRVAARLATESEAELSLLHAWYVAPVAFPGELAVAGDVMQQMSDGAAQALEAAVREVQALGVKRVTPELATGLPWRQIVDRADDPAVDLVVIGTHGRTGLARVLLGSVAETVVRHAACSVLTVRPDSEASPFSHVLCPIDFSDSTRPVIELASGLVRPGGTGLTLLHVVEPPVAYSEEPHPPELHSELEQRSTAALETLKTELGTSIRVPIAIRTRLGWPGAEILASLDRDHSLDLVVMGSHGRTGLKRLVLGSVAEKVVRHARCPVLIARRPR
jgi:nucleotide-binding universal stress UspA family protein